jgi:hypothetical protein
MQTPDFTVDQDPLLEAAAELTAETAAAAPTADPHPPYAKLSPRPGVVGARAKLADMLAQIREFGQRIGIGQANPADLERFVGVFSGPNAPCALATYKLTLVDVNTMLDLRDIPVHPLTGTLTITPQAQNQLPYTIRLREDEEQHLVGVQLERLGGAVGDEANVFPSFALVCPETALVTQARMAQQEAPALCIAMDSRGRRRTIVNGAGVEEEVVVYSVEFSNRLYLQTETNPADDSERTTNRLAGIGGKANLEAKVLQALLDVPGMKEIIQQARVMAQESNSRSNRREDLRSRARSGATPAQAPTGAPAGAPTGATAAAGAAAGFTDDPVAN